MNLRTHLEEVVFSEDSDSLDALTFDMRLIGVDKEVRELLDGRGPIYELLKDNADIRRFVISGPPVSPSTEDVCRFFQLLIMTVSPLEPTVSPASDCALLDKSTGFRWISGGGPTPPRPAAKE